MQSTFKVHDNMKEVIVYMWGLSRGGCALGVGGYTVRGIYLNPRDS